MQNQLTEHAEAMLKGMCGGKEIHPGLLDLWHKLEKAARAAGSGGVTNPQLVALLYVLWDERRGKRSSNSRKKGSKNKPRDIHKNLGLTDG